MVSRLMILLVIGTSLVVLSVLMLLVLTFPIPCIFRSPSSCLTLPSWDNVTSFVLSTLPALYGFRLTVMLLGLVIPLIVDLFLKQTAISRSSTEAELYAMALVMAKVTWLPWLLADFGVSVSIPAPLLTDSTGAISIARDPVKHELTKHIGVDAYCTRAQVQDGVVTLRYVPSELQLADFFTKAQTRAQHSFYLSKLSVFDPP
ncbi:hypothetical protein U9M48_028498 [Paspalum notatum var. saurae]|uniref:Uncharacterized protein n=1 Tax=Paspalum notatum var. saurae TaxID=547442 RepID=A0AAQ3TVJ4_PASNO